MELRGYPQFLTRGLGYPYFFYRKVNCFVDPKHPLNTHTPKNDQNIKKSLYKFLFIFNNDFGAVGWGGLDQSGGGDFYQSSKSIRWNWFKYFLYYIRFPRVNGICARFFYPRQKCTPLRLVANASGLRPFEIPKFVRIYWVPLTPNSAKKIKFLIAFERPWLLTPSTTPNTI